MPHTPMRFAAAALALVLSAAALAAPQRDRPTNDFGIDFVRIGDPGNRAARPDERFYNQRFENLGRVNYRYRISKTEVTAEQYVDFANAYEPYWAAAGGSRLDSGFTGGLLHAQTLDPNLPANFTITAGAEQRAVSVNWRVAATFCNWLHNGKVTEGWAFQAGAYETSTFGGDFQSGYTDQEDRTPGARFWIPSVNEWAKAAHYDPNRYGEGQAGYWLRMGRQNEPLVSGLAEDAGQTSAGDFLPGFAEQLIDVGAYLHVPGPWGVLDTSGGVQEWTETIRGSSLSGQGHDGRRYVRGSYANSSLYANFDLIDWYITTGIPDVSRHGIRLASAIPSPSAAFIVACMGLHAIPRRR